MHWERGELIVSYRREVGAARARALVAGALASGPVPALGVPHGRSQPRHRSVFMRVWVGVHGQAYGTWYVVAIIGSRGVVGPLTTRTTPSGP